MNQNIDRLVRVIAKDGASKWRGIQGNLSIELLDLIENPNY
jgi:hypothetical protein